MMVPVIRCAKCSKPVDEWQQENSDFSRTVRFTVKCHGETDRCDIDPREIDPLTIVEAVAFRPAAALLE